MTIKIGTMIKHLRTQNHTTQETLAAALGVTPQAISRWESEGGYPDIELLPAIADFFSVTTDELLGYKPSEREAELRQIRRELQRLSEVGTPEEQLAYARCAASRYPYVPEIRIYLAACLSDLYESTKDEAALKEAESLCLYVLNDKCDTDTHYDAVTTLSSIYTQSGHIEKAKEILGQLAPMKYCREFVLSCGIGDGNTEYYIQDEIDKLTDCLGTAIQGLAVSEDVPNDPSTWEKKIEMLKTSNALYRMIYGENLMFHHVRLSKNHWLISTFEMSLGRTEDALQSLEQMCHHTAAYDKAYYEDRGKKYTSIFCDLLIYPDISPQFHELQEHTWSYYMLERLQSKRYDSIRDNDRFVRIVTTLGKHAK